MVYTIKNIILIVLIITFIIGVNVYTYRSMETHIHEIHNHANALIDSVNNENFEKAKEQTEHIKEQWDQHSTQMALFIDHSEIESISRHIQTVRILLTQSRRANQSYDKAMILSETESIISRTRDILERERLTLANIF